MSYHLNFQQVFVYVTSIICLYVLMLSSCPARGAISGSFAVVDRFLATGRPMDRLRPGILEGVLPALGQCVTESETGPAPAARRSPADRAAQPPWRAGRLAGRRSRSVGWLAGWLAGKLTSGPLPVSSLDSMYFGQI